VRGVSRAGGADEDDAEEEAVTGPMRDAPMRDVVRIMHVRGTRGGHQLVCLLECGHWISRRARPGRFGVQCFGCVIEAEIRKGRSVSRYSHLAVIVREQTPSVTGFHDLTSAMAFFDEAQTQWSESYLVEVLKGPLV
jgi:hypothetical protein